MASSSQDIPRVVVFPPLVPLTTVVSAIVMQPFFPLQLFARVPMFIRFPIGAVLLLAGIGMMVSGRRALASNGTNVQTAAVERVRSWTAVGVEECRQSFFAGATGAFLARSAD
jgi:hypothetical protein